MLSDSILDLGKCPSRKTCTYTFMRFQLGHFPKSKFEYESIFFIKYYVFTILNNKWAYNAYLHIFSLNTSQSRKLIPKADLKWECPYYYSKKKLERFGQYLKKPKNGFPIVFSKCDLAGGGAKCVTEKDSEKAKHPQICPSFGGNVGET